MNLHAERDSGETVGGKRRVELIVNGRVVASRQVEADNQIHELTFEIPIERSSWIAIRQFPQLHTNPVVVEVGGEPIRASRRSAVWCIESIRRLWKNRSRFIKPDERSKAEAAYARAIELFAERAVECEDDGTAIPEGDRRRLPL